MAAAELDSDGDGVIDRLDRCPGTPAGTKVDINGCPALLLSLTGINFKFDSAVIEPSSSDILDRAVASLNEAKDVAVRIEGHCDSTGGEAYNELLSERRANAVQDYLVAHGIAADRLSVVGKGESQPAASNDTEEGRYQNRRVEFHVAPAGWPRGGTARRAGSAGAAGAARRTRFAPVVITPGLERVAARARAASPTRWSVLPPDGVQGRSWRPRFAHCARRPIQKCSWRLCSGL